MSSAGMETTLELWASSLRDVKARMRSLFTQDRVAASAGQFLDGLLGPERRKTGWMRAEAAGDSGPWRQQAILGRGRWDADALRDIVRDYALETLADPEAVLVIDETGFLKQGKSSCGVARQYTGSAGKITNCQIGVFAAYVSRHGHAFIDRALYLPKAWTDSPARLTAAHVPPGVSFATKPRLAMEMIRRAITAGVPFAWVAADTVYGVGEIEMALRKAGKGYVLGVKSNQTFQSWIGKPEVSGTAEDIAKDLAPSAWKRLSAGAGTKGARLYDWAYFELADLKAAEYDDSQSGLWTRGLLIRRNITDGEYAYFTTWCPAGTGIERLVTVEGQRWTIEDSFETTKNELGLDHNETRSWHGWHRHVSLVMLAFAMLATIRHHANCLPPPKTILRTARNLPSSSAGPCRKSDASPHVLRNDASSPHTLSPGRSGDAPTKPLHSARI
ncbi:Mobile element protein [Rhodovastum atsumiense]|nr:Mobile element protein [Rhodovastum atsumiense]